jgi:hypothetical protein
MYSYELLKLEVQWRRRQRREAINRLTDDGRHSKNHERRKGNNVLRAHAQCVAERFN